MTKIEAFASRHQLPALRQALSIMDASHPCWRPLWTATQRGRVPRARISASQLRDLIKFGLLERAKEGELRHLLHVPMFVVPKSSGVEGRPITDARLTNALIDRETLIADGHFRLPSPITLIRVALGANYPDATDLRLWVGDFVSYFPALQWHRKLAMKHAVKVGDTSYVSAAPSQGSAVLPVVAQSIAVVLAGAPHVHAPPVWSVLAGVCVHLDDICIAKPMVQLEAHVRAVRHRCKAVGVGLKEAAIMSTTAIVCGLQFDLEGARRWRLKPDWAASRLPELSVLFSGSDLARRRLAGIALWACRALLIPLWRIHHVMRPLLREMGVPETENKQAAAQELDYIATMLKNNHWRQLVTMAFRRPALRDMTVVFSDASIYGAGMVFETHETSLAWADAPRQSQLQQVCELEGAVMAIEEAAPLGLPILLVVDNTGVQHVLAGSNPAAAWAIPYLERAAKSLEEHHCPLWISWVAGVDNPADAASRPMGRQPGSRVEHPREWEVDRATLTRLGGEAMEAHWATGTWWHGEKLIKDQQGPSYA